MTTWTEVAEQSTAFTLPADELNDYVVVGYVANGYISGLSVWEEVADEVSTWSGVSQASTSWA